MFPGEVVLRLTTKFGSGSRSTKKLHDRYVPWVKANAGGQNKVEAKIGYKDQINIITEKNDPDKLVEINDKPAK
ncbi:hypothetical protein Trydic_g3544 [Trypoxylus dichotomus]